MLHSFSFLLWKKLLDWHSETASHQLQSSLPKDKLSHSVSYGMQVHSLARISGAVSSIPLLPFQQAPCKGNLLIRKCSGSCRTNQIRDLSKTVVVLLWHGMKMSRTWSTGSSYTQELACSPSNYLSCLTRNHAVSAHIVSLVMINGKWASRMCSLTTWSNIHHSPSNGNKGPHKCLPYGRASSAMCRCCTRE